MHENASKCMQNELCKGFMHKIIQKVHFIIFKGAKINEIHLPLYGGTPCRVKIKIGMVTFSHPSVYTYTVSKNLSGHSSVCYKTIH